MPEKSKHKRLVAIWSFGSSRLSQKRLRWLGWTANNGFPHNQNNQLKESQCVIVSKISGFNNIICTKTDSISHGLSLSCCGKARRTQPKHRFWIRWISGLYHTIVQGFNCTTVFLQFWLHSNACWDRFGSQQLSLWDWFLYHHCRSFKTIAIAQIELSSIRAIELILIVPIPSTYRLHIFLIQWTYFEMTGVNTIIQMSTIMETSLNTCLSIQV